jgi:hypothetical protein
VLKLVPVALLASLAVAGCGSDDPEPAATTTVATPQRVAYSQYGIAFRPESTWAVNGGVRPHISTVSSGAASAAIWRFPRKERLPKERVELREAMKSLVRSSRRRDPTFRRIEGHTLRVGGEPALEIRATGRVGGRQRAMRIVHIYAHGAEIVVDGWTVPTDLARADRALFDPLLRRLRITRPNP